MDSIRLKGLVLFPRLGVTSWEKQGVQKITCDLELYADLTTAAREDKIGAAVDYSEVYRVIQTVAKARKYHLIEALAGAILGAVLEGFPPVERARIRLRKTNIPFDAHLDHVEVEMEQSRR